MNTNLSCLCTDETVYSVYTVSADKKSITVDTSSDKKIYRPTDFAPEIVVDYLHIGYLAFNNTDTSNAVFDFVSKYGMPKRNIKKVNIKDFSDDAEALYSHFFEIASEAYPSTPEWILETDPMSGIIIRNDHAISLSWQTSGLLNAIEITYTLMLCGETKQLGLCKHCGAPFYAKNPKSEFCSSQCRNRFNVYKSRKKHQK